MSPDGAELGAEGLGSLQVGGGQVTVGGLHHREEGVAQPPDEHLAERPRVAPGRGGLGDRDQRRPGVVLRERVEDRLDRLGLLDDAAHRRHLVERRERVARRAAALAHDVLDGVLAELEPGVVDHVAHVARPARRRSGGGTRSAGCGCGWWAAPSAGRWCRG